VTTRGIRVGTVGLPRKTRNLAASIDVVEITSGRDLPPAPRVARRLRAAIPQAVGFTAQLSRFLWEALPAGAPAPGDPSQYGRFAVTDENLALWKRCLDHAAALAAEALVLLTGADFTPAAGNVRRLAGFLEAARRPEVPVVWLPGGPWEPAAVATAARNLGLVPAVDPLRDDVPEGPVAYLRLGPFSHLGSRMGTHDLECIADAACGRDLCFCLFATPRSLDDARALRRLMSGGPDAKT